MTATATVTRSTLIGNQAIGGTGPTGGAARGGAIVNLNRGILTVTDSLLLGNEAVGGAGTVGNGGNGLGGGIQVGFYNLVGLLTDNSVLTITDSSLEHNTARGGEGGNGGNGLGGGLGIQAGSSATVSHGSITHNKALGGEEGAGGSDGHGVGGGVYNYHGTFAFDVFTNISDNHASTSNDNIFP